jgi:hypothetical protein
LGGRYGGRLRRAEIIAGWVARRIPVNIPINLCFLLPHVAGLVNKRKSLMLVRVAVVAGACVLGAIAARAEELGPEQARAFVVGKLFSYTCFDGTAGMGRIFADGSVVGTIRPSGRRERFMNLPPGTLRIEGSSMCAHLSGMILQPCFRVEKIDYRRFRGSIAGLGFAYCDFYKHDARAEMISRRHGGDRDRQSGPP